MRLEEREREREIKEKGSVTGGAVFKKHIQNAATFLKEKEKGKIRNLKIFVEN